MTEDNRDGQAFADGLRGFAKQHGYTFAVDEPYVPGTKDFSGLIAKYKSAGVDALLWLGSSDDGITLLRQMKRQNLTIPYIQGWKGFRPQEFVRAAGTDANYVIHDGLWAETLPNPGAKILGRRFKEQFGKDSVTIGLYYANLQIIAMAIERAGSFRSPKVRDAVFGGEYKGTAMGDVKYNEKGLCFKPLLALQWWNGERMPVYPPVPEAWTLLMPGETPGGRQTYMAANSPSSPSNLTSPQPSSPFSQAASGASQTLTTPPAFVELAIEGERRIGPLTRTSSSGVGITGLVKADSGVAAVYVNGVEASLTKEGRFSGNALLKIGENEVLVTAVDVRNNKAERSLKIVREEASPSQPVARATTLLKGRYYALFVAVQDYTNKAINKLDHPVADAERIRDTLTTQYTFEKQDVTFLKNPDGKSIFKAFEELRKKIAEQDNLLIFYAGHGLWREDMQQGFWLPRDASDTPYDWISNASIRDYIRAIKAKHILLISDACFSGGIFKLREVFTPPPSIEKVYELTSRKAMTSGSLKTVPDRSVFVEYLVKRLRENTKKYLDSQSLYVSFKEAVINNSPANQTPLYGVIGEAGDEGGDFIFVRR